MSETPPLTVRRNTDWRSFRAGCWGGYFDLRRRKLQEAGKGCTMRTFVRHLLGCEAV